MFHDCLPATLICCGFSRYVLTRNNRYEWDKHEKHKHHHHHHHVGEFGGLGAALGFDTPTVVENITVNNDTFVDDNFNNNNFNNDTFIF